MAFCSSCGTQVGDGTKFCPSCGKAVGGEAAAAPAAPPKPTTEKVGNIRKCPACGAEIGSFQARCPSCGHELNDLQVSSTIKDFGSKLDKLDKSIGWSKESSGLKKFGWVVLNIYTVCIPLLVRTLRRVFFPVALKLNKEEQEKKNLIENFIVPNSREDIMEFVFFSSHKAESAMQDAGTSLSSVATAGMWANLWINKCKQVCERAGVALSEDKSTTALINNLVEKSQTIMAKAKKKALVTIAAVPAVLIVLAIAIIIPVVGVGTRLPDPVRIASENVQFLGFFDGYFDIIGEDCLLAPNAKESTLSITMEVKAIKPFAAAAKKELDELQKNSGWEKDPCESKIEESTIFIGDIETAMNIDVLTSLLKMEPKATRKINLLVEPKGGMPSAKKKAIIKIMNMPEISLSQTIRYSLTNDRRKNSVFSRNDAIRYIDL
jgi:hypothetical protein